MPLNDDHGLEVIRKSALDVGDTPKTDYWLQVKLMNPGDISGSGSGSGCSFLPGATTAIAVLTNHQYNHLTDSDGNVLILG